MGSDKIAMYKEAVSRGHQLARGGKWLEAAQFYRAAVSALPNDVLARTCLAQALYHTGNMSEALQEYEHLLRSSPRDVLLLMRMAEIRRKLGAAPEAAELYLRAADIHLEEKRKDKGLELWRLVVEIFSDNADCLELLGRACARAGERQLAAEALLGVARIYAEVADQRQALKACRRAVDLDRSNESGQQMMRSLEHGTGEWRSLQLLGRFTRDVTRETDAAEASDQETATPEVGSQSQAQSQQPGGLHAEEIITEELQQASTQVAESILEESERFFLAGDTIGAVAVLCGALQDGPANNAAITSLAIDRIRSLVPAVQKFQIGELAKIPFDERQIVINGMLSIEDFSERGLSAAATDACLEVICRFPEYLTAQAYLAELYVGAGNIEAAKEKYSCLVRLYEIRGDSINASRTRARLVSFFAEDEGASEGLVDTLLELGDLDGALDQITKVADRLLALGDAQGCLNQLTKLLELAPDRIDVELKFAEVAESIGRTADARQAQMRALSIDSGNREAILSYITLSIRTDTWSMLPERHEHIDAFFLLLSQDRNLAAMALERLNSLDGVDGSVSGKPELKLSVGACLQVLGRIDDARRSLLGAIGHSEYVDVLARHFLALAIAKKVDFNGALDQLKFGLATFDELERKHSEAQISSWLKVSYLKQMRGLYRRLGDKKGLIGALEELKLALPDDKAIAQEIIDLYFGANQPDLALQELDRIASTRASRDDLEQAVGVYRDLVTRFPKNPIVRKLLSSGCESLGLADDAANQLEIAVQLELAGVKQPDGANSDVLSSDIAKDIHHLIDLYRVNKPEKTILWRERLARLTPNDLECRTALIDAYLRMGLPAKSLAEARALARELIARGNREDAAMVLQTVLSLDPWDKWALEQLGGSLDSLARFQESAKIYQRLLAVDPENSVARVRLAGTERR